MGIWQKRLGRWARCWNTHIKVNPILIHEQMGHPVLIVGSAFFTGKHVSGSKKQAALSTNLPHPGPISTVFAKNIDCRTYQRTEMTFKFQKFCWRVYWTTGSVGNCDIRNSWGKQSLFILHSSSPVQSDETPFVHFVLSPLLLLLLMLLMSGTSYFVGRVHTFNYDTRCYRKRCCKPVEKNGWWSTKGLSSFTYYSIVECACAIILQNSSCPCGLLRGFWSPACFWAIGLGMAFNNGSGSFPSFLVLLSWCLGLVILSVEYIHLTTILRYYV